MAAASHQANTKFDVPNDAELLQAQADLWRDSFSYQTAMALRCAVKLGIPTAIHRLGGAASIPDLIAALSLPPTKQPYLRRLMRLLSTTSAAFAADESDSDRYRLTPLSRTLVDGVDADDHHVQISVVLTVTSRQYVEAAMGLDDWFRKGDDISSSPPYDDVHGAEFDAVANEALAAHDNQGIGVVLRECGQELFGGVASLTDCGGGDGATARAVVSAFPHVRCTVLDLPKVIDKAPPAADGAIHYLVLHFWSDDDCVKILTQCKKAIPPQKKGGKVIVIDILIGPSLGPAMFEAQILMDVAMMVNTRGRERDENEWRDLFFKAGFSDYKIVKQLGVRAVFEVYP
uniref:O-methyltransferase domain-containing protein n=1 Tax=Leersia perrieri TaxID=77586 RepID=A0A0D9XQL6_9ORYZ